MADPNYKKLPHSEDSVQMMYLSPAKAAPLALVTGPVAGFAAYWAVYQVRTPKNYLLGFLLAAVGALALIVFYYIFTYGFTNKPLVILTDTFLVTSPTTGDRSRIEWRDMLSWKQRELKLRGGLKIQAILIQTRDIPHYQKLMTDRVRRILSQNGVHSSPTFFLPLSLLSKQDQDRLVFRFQEELPSKGRQAKRQKRLKKK